MFKINQDILELMKEVEKAGEEIYIVGGFVRDLILGKTSYDIDLATSMDIDKLEALIDTTIFNVNTINYQYRTIKLEFMTYQIEISQFRLEYFYKDYRHPEKMDFIKSRKLDARRRDFTINSLYMNADYEIIDFHNSISDLKEKKIKTIRCPHIVFKEDALRIVRMYRFKAELDFSIDQDSLIAAQRNLKYIKELKAINLKEESIKILQSDGFRKLYQEDLDFLETIFPNADYPEIIFSDSMQWEYRLILMYDLKELKQILLQWQISKNKRNYILKMKLILDDYQKMDMNTLFLKHDTFYFFELLTFLNQYQENFVYRQKYIKMIDSTNLRNVSDLKITGEDLIKFSIPKKDRQIILKQLAFDVLWKHYENTQTALYENLARYKHDLY